MALEASRDLIQQYTRQLAAAKKKYELKIAEALVEYERRGTEAYNFYGSELQADDPATGIPSGYFSRNSLHSLYNLGGYSADRLKSEADEFRADPANVGRFVICFDAFGQGRPGAAIADETIATTLTKVPFALPPSVKEFNGDALSDTVSKQAFDHLRNRIAAGGALRVTFFRPVEGLSGVAHNLYVYHKLYEHLRTLYELTDEGGLIFISASGGCFDVKILREILHEFGLSQIANPEEDYQPRLLLRKNSSIAQELPSFKDIAAREPEFIKSILRIAK